MTISEKAIEAAARAMAVLGYCRLNRIDPTQEKVDGTDHFETWFAGDASNHKSYVDDATAALSTLPIAGEGKVKALEWREEPIPPAWESLASTGVGVYCIPHGRDRFCLRFRDTIVLGDFPTLDEAKAAAQADYETRILSALISSPGKDGGQEVEAVGCPGDKCEHFWEEAPCCNGWRPQPASTALVERLQQLYDEQHRILGEMLLDKSEEGQAKANWQGGKVNGIAAALYASQTAEPRQ